MSGIRYYLAGMPEQYVINLLVVGRLCIDSSGMATGLLVR
jgi:hypothetical protein